MLRKQKEGDSNAGARWTLGAVLLWMKVASIIAQCSKPEVKGNVVLSTEDLLKNSFSEGSTARYQCTVGYTTKSGSGVINCTNGVWSVLSLTCQKKTCEPPGEVENGYFNISEGIEFGAKIKATCNKGYMIVGRNYLQCLDSGWSGRPPVCEVVKCGDPPEIENGERVTKTINEFYQYNDVIEYKCNTRYTLIGESQIVCRENGTYDPPPVCQAVSCPNPVIDNARRVEGAPPPYIHKSFVTYKCRDGYLMTGTPKLVCEAEGWSSPFPSCIKAPRTTTTTVSTTTVTTTTKGHEDDKRSTSNKTPVIVTVVLVLVFALVIGVIFYCYRKNKGEYRTREEDQKPADGLL